MQTTKQNNVSRREFPQMELYVDEGVMGLFCHAVWLSTNLFMLLNLHVNLQKCLYG